MEKKYKMCQSCSMPLNKDPKGGGTDADGSISNKYCSLCYVEGKFVNPDWTAQQMKTFVRDILVEKGTPKFFASLMSMGIPRLERWKK